MGYVAFRNRTVGANSEPVTGIKLEHTRLVATLRALPAWTWQRLPRVLRASLKGIFAVVRATYVVTRAIVSTTCYYLGHHPIHAVLTFFLMASLVLVLLTGWDMNKQIILSKISNNTIDRIIEASEFKRDYSFEGSKRKGLSEFVGVGAPIWAQRESIRAVLYHARKSGMSIEDQAVLLAIVNIESGFNPMAQALITSACGLFQFVSGTGQIFNLSQAECMDPWMNARAGIDHYQTNFNRSVADKVKDLSGPERVFRTFELSYYLHHDGPNSTKASPEVKGIVLDGTHFLFKAYHALKEEEELNGKTPSFAEQFSQHAWRVTNNLMALVHIKE